MTTISKGTVAITSNIKERLKKIRSGNVYDGKLTFIRELVQNSMRANATAIWVRVEGDRLIIQDNGIGCKNPKTLFTLDFSGFGVGYGEGFTSIYMIADYFDVETADWKASLSIAKVLDNPRTTDTDLNVDIEKDRPLVQGFKLTLVGQEIDASRHGIEEEFIELCQYIPDIDVYLNGEIIPKKPLFDKIPSGDYPLEVDNRLFAGKLSLTANYFESGVHVYYEYRFVQKLHIEGVKGVILLKPNAVNLRAPDRTSIIYDDKRDRLVRKLSREAKGLFKTLVSNGNREQIDEYAKIIREYLDVKEYINFLEMDTSFVQKGTKSNEIMDDADLSPAPSTPSASAFYDLIDQLQQVKQTLPNSVEKEAASGTLTGHPFDGSPTETGTVEEEPVSEPSEWNEMDVSCEPYPDASVDVVRQLKDRSFDYTVKAEEYVEKNQMKGVTIKNIKKLKNVVWCSVDEKSTYQHYINEFEYKGIFTFYSPHVLYDDALKHLGIPHVSEYENAIVEEYKVTSTGARNKKEERATELLTFIEKIYGLDETFYLSNIQCTRNIELNGKKLHREKVTVNGYKQYYYIHLNRKSLYFGNIRGSRLGEETCNIHDLKFIMANAGLIAHELAHLLYQTKDNTKEHYEKEIKLHDEIVRYFVEERS